jgi:limonene 1,2-monooxygenase
MHVAATEREARSEVAYGLRDWAYYVTRIGTLTLIPEDASLDEMLDILVESGFAVIGTPAQAIAQIERLYEVSGGFGTYLLWTHDWADRHATFKSLEMIARHVAPHFRPFRKTLVEAEDWARERRPDLDPLNRAAREKAKDDYIKANALSQ